MWASNVAGTCSSSIQVRDLTKLSFMSFPANLIRSLLYINKCTGKWEHRKNLPQRLWVAKAKRSLGRTHKLHSWSWWGVPLLWIEMKNKGRRAGSLLCHNYPPLLKACRGFQSHLKKKVVRFSLESHVWSCTGLYLRENLMSWLPFFLGKVSLIGLRFR